MSGISARRKAKQLIALTLAVIYLFGETMLGWFLPSDIEPDKLSQLMYYGLSYIDFVAVFFFLMGVMFAGNSLLRGAGDVMVPLFTTIAALSTRVLAAVVVVIPLYCVAVMMAFFAARMGTTTVYGQGAGVYDHYFNTFLNPTDLIWSFVQCVAITVVIMLVHTYFGFAASGGPAGVGEAVGRAVRLSMVIAAVEIVFISLAIYGQSGNFNMAG